jgi:hypothetical protein
MAYIDVHKAIRTFMRSMPGGEDVASGGLVHLVNDPIYQRAVCHLQEAIQSSSVKVLVAGRPIADHERDYRLDPINRALIEPFGQPPLRNILICLEDLLPVFRAQIEADEQPIDIKAMIADMLRQNPQPSQAAAFKNALDHGAIITRKDFIKLWKSLGASTKQGPRGPRNNRAEQAA